MVLVFRFPEIISVNTYRYYENKKTKLRLDL